MMRWRSRRGILLAALLCMGAATAGSLAGKWLSPGKQSADEPALLQVDPLHLDFGEVWATEHFDWKLPVQNTTNSVVTLESLTGDCSCVSIDQLPLRINPGEVGQVKLRLDLTRRCMGVGPEPFASIPHPIKLRGTVQIGGQSHDVNWVLEGRVKPAILLSKRNVEFGRLWSPSLPLERSVTIRLAPGIGLAEVDAQDTSGSVSSELRPATTSGESELVVRLNRWDATGVLRAEARIAPVTRSGERLSVVRLPVTWENLHEIQPDTTTLDFGAHPLGATVEQTVTLTSLAGRSFRVTRCETDGGEGIRVEPLPQEPGASITVQIAQRIVRFGDSAGELTISGMTASGEQFVVKCRTHYFGVAE